MGEAAGGGGGGGEEKEEEKKGEKEEEEEERRGRLRLKTSAPSCRTTIALQAEQDGGEECEEEEEEESEMSVKLTPARSDRRSETRKSSRRMFLDIFSFSLLSVRVISRSSLHRLHVAPLFFYFELPAAFISFGINKVDLDLGRKFRLRGGGNSSGGSFQPVIS